MNSKHSTCSSAIALAIGASVLTAGSGVAGAQPAGGFWFFGIWIPL
jgi:hypothetical protein